MSLGRTEYADEVEVLVEHLQAKAVFLLVLDGERGSGVSAECPAILLQKLATNLRHIADQMDADYALHVGSVGS